MIFILKFFNAVYHTDLQVLKDHCIPEINPTLIMVYESFGRKGRAQMNFLANTIYGSILIFY